MFALIYSFLSAALVAVPFYLALVGLTFGAGWIISKLN